MIYELEASDLFLAGRKQLDKPIREQVGKLLLKISENPRMAKPLHGRWDFYRVRFGGYRLLYSISEKEKTVFLISVGKRDEIYAR